MATWVVIEDEEDIKNIMTVIFRAWEYDVLSFRDGNEVFAFIDEVETGDYEGEIPELVLSGLRMPGHHGNEIARRMRQSPVFGDVTIILMTAFTMTVAERQSMLEKDGCDAIISKPLPEMAELKTMIEVIHTKRKSRNE